jgi:hypothetical protein
MQHIFQKHAIVQPKACNMHEKSSKAHKGQCWELGCAAFIHSITNMFAHAPLSPLEPTFPDTRNVGPAMSMIGGCAPTGEQVRTSASDLATLSPVRHRTFQNVLVGSCKDAPPE